MSLESWDMVMRVVDGMASPSLVRERGRDVSAAASRGNRGQPLAPRMSPRPRARKGPRADVTGPIFSLLPSLVPNQPAGETNGDLPKMSGSGYRRSIGS
jgi:hypothetical protein